MDTLIWVILVHHVVDAAALQFQLASFQGQQDIANITIVKQDWYSSPNAYYSDSAIWLTAFQNTSTNGATQSDGTDLGRVVYKEPIQFTANDSSFNTSFTFQIITTRTYPDCGSGMAFFIADSMQAPKDSDNNGALGLVDPFVTSQSHSFFAVEFDTHVTPAYEDPSASHIGINVNSMISLNVTDTSPTSVSSFYPQLYLYNNSTFMTWIAYNDSSKLIQVWMVKHSGTNSTTVGAGDQLFIDRPVYPCLQLNYDLSALFAWKSMYVGFSGTSAPSSQGMEGHVIYSWSFSSEETTLPNHQVSPALQRRFKLILALTLAVGLSIFGGLVLWWVLSKRRHITQSKGYAGIETALQTARPYSYKELRTAANGFDEKTKVGEGGYGSVYKGVLSDGSVVAIKKLKQSLMLETQFCAEASIIRKVRHRYLLELHGWCYEVGRDALLVYPYMSNGSLDGYLFHAEKKKRLGKTAMLQSETRLRILMQVAAALEYLHEGLGECVLHRDVKAANVLLTDHEQVEARLCDFGLACLISHEESAVAMTVAGTPGYLAPELLYHGMATDKVDVYSFGILALEVSCGRRAIIQDGDHIYDWVWSNIIQGDKMTSEQLIHILDSSMMDTSSSYASRTLQDWQCVLHVGLMCCHPSPEFRPSMKEVIRAFDDRLVLSLPEAKPLTPYGFSSASTMPSISSSATEPATPSVLSAPR